MIPQFHQFIAVDWSGARGPRLPGLQVAISVPGSSAPRLVDPPHEKTWSRQALFDYLIREAPKNGPVLAGFDMSVAFPFCDLGCYFPGLDTSPADAFTLWREVEEVCHKAPDFYARPYTKPGRPEAEYFNANGYRGKKYDVSRLRVTDRQCLKWTRPSSVFNGVGPGSVGTGSLAGMRFFHAMKQYADLRIAIWPFDRISGREQLVLCEIFPRVYVKQAGVDPRSWRENGFIDKILRAFESQPSRLRNLTEDEIDALFSSAVLRTLSGRGEYWRPATMTDAAAHHEGWIFGVT